MVGYEWHHAAFVQNATVFYIWLDGVLVATCTDDAGDKMANVTASFIIGADHTGSAGYFSGYIDELRISTAAEYIAPFTPPVSEYAGTAYATLASCYIASPRALAGFKLYVGTANDATSTAATVKYWDGSAWTDCTTVVDGTRPAAIALAQTGSITFDSTVSTAKARILFDKHAYWYLVQWSGLNNSTYPTVYYATVNAPFQPFTDIWSGVYKKPSRVWLETTADKFIDRTTEVLELDSPKTTGGRGTYMKLNSFHIFRLLLCGFKLQVTGYISTFQGRRRN